MADTPQNKSRRDQHLERLRSKSPEKKFEDDEEIFGQISDDYDQYEQELEGYRGREKQLSDMFAADPRSAQFLTDMHNGNDPVLGLVRNFGIEIKDVLDDPEMQEKIAEANKDYVERMARSKQLDEEYDKNMAATLETLRQFQAERGMSDEEIDKVVEFLLSIIHDGIVGKFSTETLDMACKAVNYDADVAAAGEEGEVAGRNAKITENLRKSAKGDGTIPLAGKNGSGGAAPKRARSMFDEAYDAMQKRMEGEVVKFPQGSPSLPTKGSAGLRTPESTGTWVPGGMATVSNLASATGGVGPGNMAERDTD